MQNLINSCQILIDNFFENRFQTYLKNLNYPHRFNFFKTSDMCREILESTYPIIMSLKAKDSIYFETKIEEYVAQKCMSEDASESIYRLDHTFTTVKRIIRRK